MTPLNPTTASVPAGAQTRRAVPAVRQLLWVPKIWSCALTRHDAPTSWGPMCRILYRLLVSLARLAVRSGRSKDLEIIVLRHQLTVLYRLNNRPALADEDRTLLGAVAAALSRSQRAGWLVTPETLLRWHRRRIARHWTQPCRAPGRPCTSVELRRLIIEMAAAPTHHPRQQHDWPPAAPSTRPNDPLRWPHQRIQTCGLTSNDTISGTHRAVSHSRDDDGSWRQTIRAVT